ncbi:ABC-type transport auxiliary lipoprotein family protein [Massilia niastensis]|uniref:ABC-type transport auxiliary lipoprotein family protein n=1 Tax=Massilia niastensis TaxID=544911 RepID=UPI0003A144D2|nr:ABC-type transport auxiliary lipoprotein family protein [Massilia niastensis]
MNVQAPRLLIALAAAVLLAGCGSSSRNMPGTVFDFGPAAMAPAPAAQAPAAQASIPQALPALVVMDATGPAVLDNERMFYRLHYADAMEARMYANSRWSGNPLQLVTQRVKTRLAQSGMKVLSATDASNGIPILRMEVDDFTHAFSSASQSEGQLILRASVFSEHRLVDQRTFTRTTAAGSADAAGGARALAGSTDAVAADILAWLATLDVGKR